VVRRVHHDGAIAPRADGAFQFNHLILNALPQWHGWCNGLAVNIHSRKIQENTRYEN
jgi:hypothetical protein